MIKLEIVSKNNYEYILEDKNGNKYIVNLEFLDISQKPEIGDYIYLNNELLNTKYEGYSTSYTLGNLENEYGKENIAIDDIDVVKLVVKNVEIYLKRLYG
mgnify:CR=1 FL=1